MAWCKSERWNKIISVDGELFVEYRGQSTFSREDNQTAEEFLSIFNPGRGPVDTGLGHINTVTSNDGNVCLVEHSGRWPWDSDDFKPGEIFGFSYDRATGRPTEIKPIIGGRIQ
jgi:hypothetical protein